MMSLFIHLLEVLTFCLVGFLFYRLHSTYRQSLLEDKTHIQQFFDLPEVTPAPTKTVDTFRSDPVYEIPVMEREVDEMLELVHSTMRALEEPETPDLEQEQVKTAGPAQNESAPGHQRVIDASTEGTEQATHAGEETPPLAELFTHMADLFTHLDENRKSEKDRQELVETDKVPDSTMDVGSTGETFQLNDAGFEPGPEAFSSVDNALSDYIGDFFSANGPDTSAQEQYSATLDSGTGHSAVLSPTDSVRETIKASSPLVNESQEVKSGSAKGDPKFAVGS